MYNLNNIVEEQMLYVHTNGEWQEDTTELFLSNIIKEKKQSSCQLWGKKIIIYFYHLDLSFIN